MKMLSSLTRNTVYRLAVTVLWFLVLVGLPLTSFPILSRVTGAIVAPFSAIPLALLMVIWLVPYLLERGKFPAEIIPYLYFILIAIIVSAMAFFLNGTYARGRDFFDQSLRAFITLGIGFAFYLTIVFGRTDEEGNTLASLTGMAPAYGLGGYEIQISELVLDTSGIFWVQVYDQDGVARTEKIFFDTYEDCTRNLILLNFIPR